MPPYYAMPANPPIMLSTMLDYMVTVTIIVNIELTCQKTKAFYKVGFGMQKKDWKAKKYGGA